MEYEQTSVHEAGAPVLPKWVKILFRFYAIVFLLYTIVIGVYVIISGKELLAAVSDFVIPDSEIVAIELFVFISAALILEVFYGIGVYKVKRWVLPLVLTFSFSTLLISLLKIFNLNFTGIADLVGLLLGMIFMGIVGFAGIKYWNVFTGSARKLLIQIPLLLLLLPFIVFATLSQIFTDDPQINDADIVLQLVEVLSESDNAHYFLPDIDALSVRERESYKLALSLAEELDRENFNTPEAINLVNQIKTLTDAVIEASSKSGYQCPTVVNSYGFDTEVCSLSDIRDLALLTSFRAGVEADTGDSDQAIATAASIVKLGSLMGNTDNPLLIEYLVGIGVQNIGLESLERTLDKSSSTTNNAIISAISELEQSKINDKAFVDSLRRDYMSVKDVSKPFEPYSNYFYQHNKTTNVFAELLREQIERAQLGCDVDVSQQQKVEQLVAEIRSAPTTWPLISPNYVGKVINSVFAASLNTAEQKRCEVNELNQSVQELLKKNIIIEPKPEIIDAD